MDARTSRDSRAFLIPVLVLLLAPTAGSAQVFRCTDADGAVIFRQTPCAEAEARPDAPAAVAPAPAEGADCRLANRFAGVVARYMRAGATSDQVFDRYGGVDTLSRSSVGVINYVYSFRTSDTVSVERIAGLSQAKCEAEAFGALRCENLPQTFTRTQGGCEFDEGDENGAQPARTEAPEPEPERQSQVAYGRPQEPDGRSDEAVEHCKRMYRDQIDAIDAQMRRGYSSEQGERYRDQLRGLTIKLRACDS